jgi:hypothetical protein
LIWVLLLALHAGTGVGDVEGFDAISLVFDDYEACMAAAASMERRLIEAPVTAICVAQAAASVQAQLARKALQVALSDGFARQEYVAKGSKRPKAVLRIRGPIPDAAGS